MEEEEAIKQQVLRRTLEEVQTTNSPSYENDPCVICLESVSERAIASPCKHESFDFLCLVSWLQERSTCPLCQSNIRSLRYRCQPSGEYKLYTVPEVKAASLPNTSHGVQARSRGRPQPASRRSRQPSYPRQPVSPDAALLRRKKVYRQNVYSSHVGSNRLSKYKDLTPQTVARDEELVSRARKWIRRELKVFDFINADEEQEAGVTKRANNAEFLMEYIIAILKTVDIKGAGGQAEDMLQDFLGRDNTRLFLHELRAWLRSPYKTLEDWDRHVQYGGLTNAYGEDNKKHANHNKHIMPPRTQHTNYGRDDRYKRAGVDRYSPYHSNGSRNQPDRFHG